MTGKQFIAERLIKWFLEAFPGSYVITTKQPKE